jgi:hypothetical protein
MIDGKDYSWEHLARALYHLKQTTIQEYRDREVDIEPEREKAQERIARRYESYCPDIIDVYWSECSDDDDHQFEVGDYVIAKEPQAPCTFGGEMPYGVYKVYEVDGSKIYCYLFSGNQIAPSESGNRKWECRAWELVRVELDGFDGEGGVCYG